MCDLGYNQDDTELLSIAPPPSNSDARRYSMLSDAIRRYSTLIITKNGLPERQPKWSLLQIAQITCSGGFHITVPNNHSLLNHFSIRQSVWPCVSPLLPSVAGRPDLHCVLSPKNLHGLLPLNFYSWCYAVMPAMINVTSSTICILSSSLHRCSMVYLS